MSNILQSMLQRAESHLDDMATLELQAMGMSERDDDEAKYMSTLDPALVDVDDMSVAQMTEGERFIHEYRS